MRTMTLLIVVASLFVGTTAWACQARVAAACTIAGPYCDDGSSVCTYDCREGREVCQEGCLQQRTACLAACPRGDRRCRAECMESWADCRRACPANCQSFCIAQRRACLEGSAEFCDGALDCENACREEERQCVARAAAEEAACLEACPTADDVARCRADCAADCAAGRPGARCRTACNRQCPASMVSSCKRDCRRAEGLAARACRNGLPGCIEACQEPFAPCWEEREACFDDAEESLAFCLDQCPRGNGRCRTECRNAQDADERDCRATFMECIADLLTDADDDGLTPYEGDCDDADATVWPGAPEVCDGRDNSCEGLIDEGIPAITTSCGIGDCGSAGELACLGGLLVDSCVPGEPGDDSDCDAADDDCDGPADEHFVPAVTSCGLGPCAATGQTSCVDGAVLDSCQPGAPAEEVCNGIDDDCDGALDETCLCIQDLALVSDEGTLANGSPAVPTYSGNARWTAHIEGATWIWSSFFVAEPKVDTAVMFTRAFVVPAVADALLTGTLEVAADNSYLCTLNGLATYESAVEFNYFQEYVKVFALDGALLPGENVLRCEVLNWAQPWGNATSNPAGLLFRLEVRSQSVATDERCDGSDNDCDGEVDEEFPQLGRACSVGLGACLSEGVLVCSGDGLGTVCDAVPGAASEELCGDFIDNDCDGAIDEGCVRRCETRWPYPCEYSVAEGYNRIYHTAWSINDYAGLQQLVQARGVPMPAVWDTTMVQECEVLVFDTSATHTLRMKVLTPAGARYLPLVDPGPWTPDSRGWWPDRGGQPFDLAQVLEDAGFDPTTPFSFALGTIVLDASNTYKLEGMEPGEFMLAYNDGGLQAGDRDANEPLMICSRTP